MSLLFKILYFNDIIVPMIAILLNILLLWLIKTTKTKNLIHINYSLVPNSILDIIVSILNFIVAPHFFHIDGNLYIVYRDLFGFIDPSFASHVSALVGAISMINAISVTVSFYIQYLVICRHQKLLIRTMFLPYFLLFFGFIIFYVLILWFNLAGNEYIETNFLINLWKQEYGTTPLVSGNKVFSPSFISASILTFTTYNLAFASMFYYSKQIARTLKVYIDISGSKLLHKQIQRTLFVQAIVPLLIGGVPILLIILRSFLQLGSVEISLILSMSFPWIPITSPIAAFIIIKPYRNYFKNIFKFYECRGKTLKIIPVEIKT